MKSEREQLRKLFDLQAMAGHCEINTVMLRSPGDVAFVSAVDVPNASQICAAGDGYDVWRHRDGKLDIAETGLDVGAAANVVILEYMTEKVRRAKRNNKQLRRYSDEELLSHLLRGYQHADRSDPHSGRRDQ